MANMAKRDDATTIERLLVSGDLDGLSTEQRVTYYHKVCESLDLNPLTRPFDYLKLNGKTVLYARRDCTEQLRKKHTVSIRIMSRELVDGVYVVTAQATMPDGRVDESVGAVPIEALKGEARANAFMKAETKAKRRVTLSICGLGMLDETEVEEPRPMTSTADGEAVGPRPVAKASPEASIVADFRAKMRTVGTEAELRAVGAEVGKSKLSPEARRELADTYGQELAKVRAGAA